MTDSLAIALAQINPVVGDVDGNAKRVIKARAEAAAQGADLMVTGELALAGYPPEDLVLKPAFQAHIQAKVEELATLTADGGPAVLLGTPWVDNGKVYNAVALLDGGAVQTVRYKHKLPNYGVFDEVRVFAAGPCPGPINVRGLRIGVMICEDMWFADVAETLVESGAEMLMVLNGSPFEVEKPDLRLNYAVSRVVETGLPLVYVNLVGGQDELVFDGASFVLGADQSLRCLLPDWQEAVATTQWSRGDKAWGCEGHPIRSRKQGLEAIWMALVTGLRDYVDKNGFPGVLIGMSGGIDSALSAAVAVDALGADRVRCVMMPSPYTSTESLEDAAECCKLIGAQLDSVSIEPAMKAFKEMLDPIMQGAAADTTEENIQARARGMTLMALSNKFGSMVLSTGNKSEMSVGYATLYGDMCGGYSVLKDVYKTTVFALSRWRNENRPTGVLGPEGRVIPERIITKPPTAELKPDQKDEDSLPPYDLLDKILHGLIEEEKSRADLVAAGFDAEIVARVWRMLDRAEYKRRQAPPGVKITARAFGRDRRYPIVNGFTNLG